MTTLLILLPLAAALLIWVLPLNDISAGALALLAALAEVGLWIQLLVRYDFTKGGLQFAQQRNWFSDLHVSYHVGVYGFSVWLVGLTVVAMAAAIAYGLWAGRERLRAYMGLMLFLTGAVVGVFTAQDLLLFYAFFEAMMIPLYVLVGVWGGPGRMGATLKFVLYTMTGSLLMLASIVVYGLSQNTFDLVQIGQSSSDWVFLGFVAAFAIKAPIFPLHGWLPDAYRESSPEVAAILSGVISKAGAYGLLRIAIAKFPDPAAALPHADPRARRDRPDLRVAARVPGTRHPRGDRLFVARADGADHDGPLRGQRPRARRLGPPDGQPRSRLDLAVPARRHGRAADAHR